MASPLVPILGVDFTDTASTRYDGIALGTELPGNDGNTYRYVQATTALTAGDFVTLDDDDANAPYAVEPTSSASGQDIIGVANVTTTINYYCWIVVRGYVAAANVANAVNAADALVGSSASAGRIDLITFTTTAATLAQLTAGHLAARSVGIKVLAAASGNKAAVLLM